MAQIMKVKLLSSDIAILRTIANSLEHAGFVNPREIEISQDFSLIFAVVEYEDKPIATCWKIQHDENLNLEMVGSYEIDLNPRTLKVWCAASPSFLNAIQSTPAEYQNSEWRESLRKSHSAPMIINAGSVIKIKPDFTEVLPESHHTLLLFKGTSTRAACLDGRLTTLPHKLRRMYSIPRLPILLPKQCEKPESFASRLCLFLRHITCVPSKAPITITHVHWTFDYNSDFLIFNQHISGSPSVLGVSAFNSDPLVEVVPHIDGLNKMNGHQNTNAYMAPYSSFIELDDSTVDTLIAGFKKQDDLEKTERLIKERVRVLQTH